MERTATLPTRMNAPVGPPLIAADIATARVERRRGLLHLDHYRRMLILRPARQIHTFGMQFAIDVAWCDRSGVVLRTASVVPNRLSAWVFGAHAVLEAEAGTFVRLGIAVGDRLACLPVGGSQGCWIVKCRAAGAAGHT